MSGNSSAEFVYRRLLTLKPWEFAELSGGLISDRGLNSRSQNEKNKAAQDLIILTETDTIDENET